MHLTYLETFVTLAEVRSFSKAAALLYVSQPALTQRIHKLEADLGFELIQRENKNSFSLTPAGKRFLKFSVETLNSFQDAIHDCRHLSNSHTQQIILGMEQFDLNLLNREWINSFHHQNPDVDFNIEYSMHADLLDHLYRDDYNIVFIAKPEQLSADYEYFHITYDPFIAVCSPDSTLPKGPVTFDDISGDSIYLPAISYSSFRHLEEDMRLKHPDISIHRYQTIAYSPKLEKHRTYITNEGKSMLFQKLKWHPLDTKRRIDLGFVTKKNPPQYMMDFIEEMRK